MPNDTDRLNFLLFKNKSKVHHIDPEIILPYYCGEVRTARKAIDLAIKEDKIQNAK